MKFHFARQVWHDAFDSFTQQSDYASKPLEISILAGTISERLKEVNQLAASLKELRGRNRTELVTEHRDKLTQRRTLNQASRRLSELRKRRERILAEDIPRKEKQLRLDAIQKRINAVVVKVPEKSETVF